ncbi:MAG: diaminopimelate decarboxylase [Acidimicrobiia bacterium]|nr:diaminopimelate decarboxylase [Acidimicrobiia bacterium]
MPAPVPGFIRIHGEFCSDDVALSAVAEAVGTPTHVYSRALLRERYTALDSAFAGYPHDLHYAIKANATLAVVREMREAGAHADANSGGEIELALRAGFSPDQIVFTGVGKTHDELVRAVTLGVKAINAESPGEMERIQAIAATHNTVARVAVRVNPDVEAGSHPNISTGHKTTKFGMSVVQAYAMVTEMAQRPNLRVVGLHVHIGSQITDALPLTQAAATIATMATTLAEQGIALEHLDIGGGLGIAYEPWQRVLSPEEYAAAVLPVVRPTGLRLVLEPGRWITGPAGVLLARVVDLKQQADGRQFVIVDAGMTDLIRPALYNAWHEIEAVLPRDGAAVDCDIAGPVCETSDTLGKQRSLPPVMVGDLIVVRDTGAYGSVMASNYNRRPFAAEVMVDGRSWRVVRRRQTVDDMLQWEA